MSLRFDLSERQSLRLRFATLVLLVLGTGWDKNRGPLPVRLLAVAPLNHSARFGVCDLRKLCLRYCMVTCYVVEFFRGRPRGGDNITLRFQVRQTLYFTGR